MFHYYNTELLTTHKSCESRMQFGTAAVTDRRMILVNIFEYIRMLDRHTLNESTVKATAQRALRVPRIS